MSDQLRGLKDRKIKVGI